MNIELNNSQIEKFDKWKQSFGDLPNIGAFGGHFALKITFTSIGEVIEGISWDGKTINLTENLF